MRRILHVIGSMNRGGVETWLVQVLRTIDRSQYQMDFAVHTPIPAAYDKVIQDLGSRIIPCVDPSRPFRYGRQFKCILNEYGPYDVVHSHVHHYSGYVLRLSYESKIPVRIAHSHSDTSSIQTKVALNRKAYLRVMQYWLERYATIGLGVSQKAAAALFGPAWKTNPKWHILHCGIDLTPFEVHAEKVDLRHELRIPPQSIVLGHVGRLVPVKNHQFLLEVFQAYLQEISSDAHLILVGDGPLRSSLEQLLQSKNLAEKVHILGMREDVPRIIGAIDVMVFPSLYEGLPMALIEAQAAGLPCLVADTISEESDIGLGLIHFMSLRSGPNSWLQAIQQCYGVQPPDWLTRKRRLQTIGYDVRQVTSSLQDLYEGGGSI